MDCAACGVPNRAGAAFCDSCGSALTLDCPACGTRLRAAARFCDACGHAVAAAAGDPAPPEGERKQVTVLFADVKGSMELGEGMDAEEWRGIMERFFTILCAGVHRFDGTVDKFTGDGGMVLFGAPIAHEDHAWRACSAALHLKEALTRYGDELRAQRGLDFSVRWG